MSPEHTADAHDVDPGPATLEHILDDLREADIAVSENPTYDTTHADVGSMNLRGHLPSVSIKADADELGLDAHTSAWPTPNHERHDDAVTLAISSQGDGDLYTSTSVEMEAEDARDLAVQLLSCAAVVDQE